MLDLIKELLGFGPKVDYKSLVQNGATIIDVRTKGEFAQGHVKGSVNVPLWNLSGQMARLKKNSPIITCCASGGRSGQAKSMLKANGFTEVHNGGGWTNLDYKLR